jgi:mxaL protein
MNLRRFNLRLWFRAQAQHPQAWSLTAGAVALGLALLNPTIPVGEDLVHALIVVDITQSMGVMDSQWKGETVTRLEQSRRAISELLQEVPCGSEIGIGVFNEYRTFVLLAPLEVCSNFRELQATIDTLSNRMSWAGASEIAKGINSGLQAVKSLANKPAFVLLTDGHEAPPISLAHRPRIDAKPGDFNGVLVGTGSLRPQQIPKFDPEGNRIGFWRADEVSQVDIYSQGRESSVSGEQYAEDPADVGKPKDVPKAPEKAPEKAGQEHLSSLHEAYLQMLSTELGLGYLRLKGPGELHRSLIASNATRRETVSGDGRWLLALMGLVILVITHIGLIGAREMSHRVYVFGRARFTERKLSSKD